MIITPNVAVNEQSRLYIIPSGGGASCLGFDVAERRRTAVLQWMGESVSPVEVGTQNAYMAYLAAMAKGSEHAHNTGSRCPAELIPALEPHIGWRVEVTSTDGSSRRFIVGRSTGWMPCNLEIATRRSSGGAAAYLAPGDVVRRIAKVR